MDEAARRNVDRRGSQREGFGNRGAEPYASVIFLQCNIAHVEAHNVVLTKAKGFVSLAVEDDGAGFDPEAAMMGRLGLLGMLEPAELVGGAIDVESTPDSGTTILVQVPISKGEE